MAITLTNYQATLSWDASEYTQGMTDANSKWDTFTSGVSGAAKTIGTGLVAGISAATAAVVGFSASAVSTGMEFDSAMSQVAATMGKTTEEIQDLRDYAIEMGSTTAFTATEAAEGLNILAMAGLDADQQMAALDDVLNLASAGALSLESAASYTTGTIKGFGDSVENASYYTDMIAKGATLSNTSVSELGAALSGCSATANSYGQEADSVTLSLLRLAESNVTGTEATTALNRAMADVYTPTDAAKAALDELGVSAYTSTGEARDFNDIVNELNGALSGMSDEEANAYKNTIFTTQGLNAFNKMAMVSTETQEEFADALANATGSAAEQAATQLDNLSGDITIFNSALDGAKIALSDELTPALRECVGWATSAVSTLTSAYQEGGLSAMFSEMGTVISDALALVTSLLPQAVNAGTSLFTALVQGLVDNTGALLNAAKEIVVTIVDGLVSAAPSILQSGAELIDYLITGLKENLPSAMTNAANIIGQLVNSLITGASSLIPEVLSVGVDIIGAVLEGIVQSVPALLSYIPTILSNIVQLIANNLPLMQQAGGDILQKIADGFVELFPAIISTVGEVISLIWDTILNTNWLSVGVQILELLISGISSTLGFLTSIVGTIISTIWNTITSTNWLNLGVQILEAVSKGILSVLSTITNAALKAGQSAFDKIKNLSWLNLGKMLLQNISSGISGAVSSILSAASSVANSAISKFKSMDFAGAGKSALSTISSGIKNAVSSLTSAASSVASSAISKFKSVNWSAAGKSALTTITSGLSGAVGTLTSKAKSVANSAISAFKGVSWKSVGTNIISGIKSGITSAASSLYTSLKNLAKNALSAAKSALGIHSPSTVFHDEVGTYISEGIAEGVTDDIDNTADSMTADINDMVAAVQDDVDGVSLSAGLDTSNVTGSISSTIKNSSFVSGFGSILTSSLDRLESILSGATIGNTGVSGARSTVINMGNITVSGVLDKDAAEQVKEISDGQIDILLDTVAPLIPA